jgi:broad specificity phosphatase PhoE
MTLPPSRGSRPGRADSNPEPTADDPDSRPQAPHPELWLVRHGETEWSLSGAHTGSTDIKLTAKGREDALAVGRYLGGRRFALVLVSPLQRARETCRLASYDDVAEVEPNLREWTYGDIEGRTTAEVRAEHPGWSLWEDGPPHGESVEQVAARARAVIARADGAGGDVLLFAHGHVLRILTACWLGLAPDAAQRFALGTASLGMLGYEREARAILRWNLPTSE